MVKPAVAPSVCNLVRLGEPQGEGVTWADTRGRFPAGYESAQYDPGWAWGSAILPVVEQNALYNAAGVTSRRFGDGANPAPCGRSLRPVAQIGGHDNA